MKWKNSHQVVHGNTPLYFQDLYHAFDAQVSRSPDAAALVHRDETWNYRTLKSHADSVAAQIQAAALAPESIIGVCMPRNAQTVAAFLGILKAGCAYVALDPAYPDARLNYILRDSAAQRLLATPATAARFPEFKDRLLVIDWNATECPALATAAVAGERLAYLIYTSGSTGQPKGVQITHAAVLNLLHWGWQEFDTRDCSGMLAATSFCFDLSTFELFLPLLSGGTVFLVDTAWELAGLPQTAQISFLNTVPAVAQTLLDRNAIPASVRVVALAGEPLRAALVNRIYAETAARRVVDLYGPSETTTYSTCAPRARDGLETIGTAIANTCLYLLDGTLQPVPDNALGEIYIGGAGVARGYLGRYGLTAERFLPDPFCAIPGQRMYRTGDLALRDAAGNLLLRGRVDHQVKVRGFRIELGEIDTRLLEHQGVHEAVVTVRDDLPGGKQLVAYVVAKHDVPVEELRAYLGRSLPEHMVPAVWVPLDELPRNQNGKIDRSALPAPDRTAAPSHGDTEPRTAVEAVLAEEWARLLELPRVGREDNFLRCGGHSLLAVRLVGRIEQRFGVKLPLVAIFQAPTIAELAKLVETRSCSSTYYSLVPIQASGSRPPLFAAHHLNLLDMPKYLREDQPLYLLRYGMAGAVADEPVALPDIVTLARHYIEEMRRVQPQGPYHLLGQSFGGILAYEMACQLRAQGETADLVALLDTHLYPVTEPVPFADGIKKLLQLPWSNLLSRANYRITMLWRQTKYGTDYWPHIYTGAPEAALATQFQPQHYQGDIVMFKAELGWNSIFKRHIPLEEHWRQYIHGDFIIKTVPGTHTGILEDPNVKILAAGLQEFMDAKIKARQQAAGLSAASPKRA